MDRSVAPSVSNLIELTKLPVQKEVVNGVELNFVKGGSAPLLKLELVYNAGSKYQSQALVASLGFDILKDGSKKLNGSAFKETINGLGVYYGMDISKDFGTLSFYVLERNLEALLKIVKDLISSPNLPESEFNRLRDKQKNDFLIDCEKTGFLARQKFAEVLFNDSVYGKVAHHEDFDKVEYSMAVDFINDQVVGAPFKFLVAGDVSDHSHQTLIEFTKGLNVQPKEQKKNFSLPSPILGNHVIKKDTAQCSVIMGKLMPNKQNEDIHKVSISNTLFGGYFGSRLMQNIREDKGWTYGIHSSILNYENASSLVISADVLKDKGEATIAEVKKEIEKLQSELIKEEELAVLKNYLKGKLLKSFDGAFEQVDRFFSVDSFGLDWSYYDSFIETLEKITPQDIQSIAKQYFNWSDFVIVKVGGA